MIRIENEILSIGVKRKGAELSSMVSLGNRREYLWNADPLFWARHSCILFPVIGRMLNDQILLEGKKYPMTKHGLVRDKMFEVFRHTTDELVMHLTSDEQTKECYPFEFELQASYSLNQNSLKVSYLVHNLDQKIMPFNIGAHPAFNCPMEAAHSRSDYILEFEKKETQSSPIISKDGYIGQKHQAVMNDSSQLHIHKELFDYDAIILDKLHSNNVTLKHSSGKKYLNFEFEDFDQLGIWSANQESAFVCIEPWLGTADHTDFDGEFKTKPSIQFLKPGGEFSCSHHITILDL